MKVLVINEPFVKGFCRTQRWAARTRGRVLRPPDWLAYATAVLERDGVKAQLYDFPAMNWGKKELKALIIDEEPDFVVLDSTTPSIYSDIECAGICKQKGNTRVIMVGPHASALPEETLELAKGAVDVVAIGEYDYTVRDIVRNYDRLQDIEGIAYFENGRAKRTPARKLIEDLDNLPFPAWHHLDIMRYFDGGKLYPYTDIIAGRGCPYGCIFCLWPQVMHGHRYRLRSAENVVNEMEYNLRRWPQFRKGEFFFEDDTFTVDKKRALEICELILRKNLKVTWSVNSRADISDVGLFKVMKRAGCRELLVGFESGDQEILGRIHKNLKLEQAREFMRAAREARLDVHGCFVLGLPGETLESIEKTLRFANELDLTTIQFSAAVPFPGTRYYDWCKKEGFLRATSWADWLKGGEQASVVEYPGLSSRKVDSCVDRGLNSFYFRPKFMLRFLITTRNFGDLYRKVRGAGNFISYLISRK